jgi:serine/threonine protein kinase
MIGQHLGHYQILAKLGEGGMGQVYRARDTRLGREVALKILPPDLARNPASLSRFEQEARHVAALNHPNIVALFDIGSQAGVTYIITELVDGSTLRGATLPVRKLTEIGAQVADAVAAAHGAGVMHRDIKPDNVMVTREGRVKVLDFGVAKSSAAFAHDAKTTPQTAIRAVVGTVGYMAPEQVRGDAVDPRADIFAVGALLYELLAGGPPFTGETAAEVMTATLRSDPPELRPGIPDGLQRIVRRCLEKNPEERFQSARDLAFALRQLTGSSSTAVASVSVRTTRVGARLWLAVAGFALGVLLTGAAVIRWNAVEDAAIDRVQLTRLTSDRRNEFAPALSPDARSLAYLRVGGILTELLVKPLDSFDPIAVVRSNTAISFPFWSSDGNQVCYADLKRDVWCVGAAGGSPRQMLQNAYWPRITPDGRDVFFVRVFEQQPWLHRRGSDANNPPRIAGLPTDLSTLSPVSPDGSSIVIAAQTGRWIVSLSDGARRELPLENAVRTHAVAWLPDSRHIIVAEETTTLIGSRLFIQDTRSAARRLVIHTADHIDSVTASSDGQRLVYAGGPVERDVVEYSGDGKYVRTVAASSMLEGLAAWAPAGDRFVYRIGGPGQSDSLWVATASGGPPALVQRLTSNAASQTPISPDGGRIAFADLTGIRVVPISGGRAIQALASESIVGGGVCWSADGEWIWYSEGPRRLGRIPGGGGEPVFIAAQPGILLDCSPDGRWLVRRAAGGFVLTSTDGKSERLVAQSSAYAAHAATSAQFGARGKVLYLLGLDRRTIDVLDVDSGQKVRAIAFDIPLGDQIEAYGFSPDGTRVLLTTGGDRNDLWMAEGFARPATSWRRWWRHWESPERASGR